MDAKLIQRLTSFWKKRADRDSSSTVNYSQIHRAPGFALEPRIMLDAAMVSTGAETLEEDAEARQEATPPPSVAQPGSDELAEALESIIPQAMTREVFLIDPSVPDYEVLLDGIADTAQVHILSSSASLEEIASVLSNYQNLDAVHIISHGSTGSLALSGETVSTGSLESQQETLATIGQSLNEEGDILLYGCNVGGEGAGTAFLNVFAEATGADIAGSDDLTGASSQGGDWDLEVNVGEVSALILNGFGKAFNNVLGTSDENFDSAFEAGTSNTFTHGDWTFTKGTAAAYAVASSGDGVGRVYGVLHDETGKENDRAVIFNEARNVVVSSFGFKSTDGSDFKLDAFDFGADRLESTTGTITVSLNGNTVGSSTFDLSLSSSSNGITYTNSGDKGDGPYGTFSFDSTYQNVDEVAFSFTAAAVPSLDNIQVSPAVVAGSATPGITSATYDATTGILVVTGTDFVANSGATNDVDTSLLTLTGDNGATYSLTSSDVEITSATVFTITLNSNDRLGLNGLLNSNGTSSGDATTYNLSAADDWMPGADAATDISDTTNGITVSNVVAPTITSATYDANTNELTVTGTGFARYPGATNDIDVSAFTFTGEAAGTYTLTSASDVEITSDTSFSYVLSGADIAGVEALLNLNGSSSDSNTTYNLAAADNWLRGAAASNNITDASGNGITVSNVNNAPGISGNPSDITVTEDTGSNLELSSVTFADIDGDSLTVTLAVSAGTMTASSAGGVTVGGSGTGILTLVGTAANINTYLDTVTYIQYTGASNVNGDNAATLTISAVDSSNAPLASNPAVNIDITAVNDGPTVTGEPTDITVTADTASNLDLSTVTFADVDGDALTVTLSASTGTMTATSAGGVTVGGSGTGTLTFAGTAANINTYLDTVTYIQYTGASNVNGDNAATLTISAVDSSNAPLASNPAVNIDITAVNDGPTVTGEPTDITVTEDTASNLDLSTVTFADVDGDALTVTLSASTGTMTATSAGGVTVGGSGTGTLTFAGTAANINTYLDTVTYIQYTGASNVNGDNAATLTISAVDSSNAPLASNPAVNIDITAVNDGPTVTGEPTDITVTEDTASNLDLSTVTFADVDGDALTVTLSASTGTMTATSAGGVTVGGSGTGTLTFAGTAANINTYLDTVTHIQYTGASNVNGDNAATLTISAVDSSNAPLASNPAVNIDITAVNDGPTVTGEPTDITVTEDTASNLDLSTVTFADVDGDALTVTLSASTGTMTATSAGGVTVGGSGTGTLTFAGTAANINTYLDTVTHIQYTGASNVNGDNAATLTISAVDSSNAPLASNPAVNIDITAVNDGPTVTGEPTDITVTEDTASNLDLSTVTFADVDGDALTVTLSASTGTMTATSAGGVTVGGSGTGTLTFAGTAANINTYLDTVTYIQYTGASNVNGDNAATLTISAVDSSNAPLASNPAVNIDIAAVDDPSVVVGTLTGNLLEGNVDDPTVTAMGSLIISDVDVDDSPVFSDQVSTAGDKGYGSFVLTDGTWTYTLNQSAIQNMDAGDVVTDTITYVATDGTDGVITVTINGSDDAAVISGTVSGSVTEGNVGDSPVTATGSLVISDVDSDNSPTFIDQGNTTGDNGYGVFVLSSGVWTYTLDASTVQSLNAGDTVTDTTTFMASDGTSQRVSVTISGEDEPVVVNTPSENSTPPVADASYESTPEPGIPDPLLNAEHSTFLAMDDGLTVETPASNVKAGVGNAVEALAGDNGLVTAGQSGHSAFAVQGLFNQQDIISARYGSSLMTDSLGQGTVNTASASQLVQEASNVNVEFEAELGEEVDFEEPAVPDLQQMPTDEAFPELQPLDDSEEISSAGGDENTFSAQVALAVDEQQLGMKKLDEALMFIVKEKD